MISPVKLAGVDGVDSPDSSREGAVRIRYESPGGIMWLLYSSVDGEWDRHGEVLLVEDGWSDGVSEPDFDEAQSVFRFGAYRKGWSLPAFDGTLKLVIRGNGRSTSAAWRDFQRAWSAFDGGRLVVAVEDSDFKFARVVLKSFSVPNTYPRGGEVMEVSVAFRALDGCWLGDEQEYVGDVEFVPGGEVPAQTRLWWDGSSTTLTFPNGQAIALKQQDAGERFINLDRGFMGQVTTPDGVVDSAMWAAFRGKISGVELAPRESHKFKLGTGLRLLVTPRYLNPWR